MLSAIQRLPDTKLVFPGMLSAIHPISNTNLIIFQTAVHKKIKKDRKTNFIVQIFFFHENVLIKYSKPKRNALFSPKIIFIIRFYTFDHLHDFRYASGTSEAGLHFKRGIGNAAVHFNITKGEAVNPVPI